LAATGRWRASESSSATARSEEGVIMAAAQVVVSAYAETGEVAGQVEQSAQLALRGGQVPHRDAGRSRQLLVPDVEGDVDRP